MLQRTVGLSVGIVVENSVALAKCSASGVLAREPHAMSLCGDAGKSERFRRRPIERFLAGRHGTSNIEQLLDFRMRLKIFWQLCLRQQQSREFRLVHSRLDFFFRFRSALIAAPGPAQLFVNSQIALRA